MWRPERELKCQNDAEEPMSFYLRVIGFRVHGGEVETQATLPYISPDQTALVFQLKICCLTCSLIASLMASPPNGTLHSAAAREQLSRAEWALSSAGSERTPHTRKVAGSIPAAPTEQGKGQRSK